METATGAGAKPALHAQPPSRQSHNRRRAVRIAVIVASVCLAAALGVGAAWAYSYNALDLTWYTNHRDDTEFTVSNAGQMQAFAALVNGDAVGASGKPLDPVSFEGKTVKLGGGVNLGFSGEFTPIGTAKNPFKGTFDGQGNAIGGLNITKPTSTNGIGLFGVTGEGSHLLNVSLDDSAKVTLTSDDASFENVGSLVGLCGGRIDNCQSRARVTLMHTATDVSGEVMKNVGGLVGNVQGPMGGAQFAGILKAETPANAYTEEGGKSKATVVENVGGVVGYFGGDLSDCMNAGQLLLITSGKSGVDRFGSSVDAKSLYVGGVGGYGLGNVEGCSNTANLFTTSIAGASMDDMGNENARQADGGADGMGGVVGSLRGIAMAGLGDNRGDPGLEPGAPKLTLSNCSNTGYVSGLHTVGGIVGAQGSNTEIRRCTNGMAGLDATSNVGHVRTTRWNKPSGGGIAGQSWGTISYSRNHGQSENTKTGYFTAGICGMLERHEQQKSTPEIYACYSTGNVYCGGATAAYREGGIVGENDHFCNVHDNVFMYGTVSTQIKGREDADDAAAGANYGTVANTTVVYETPKQAAEKNGVYIGSGEAVAILNKLAANDGWASYYFITKNANNGFPVLNGQAEPDGRIDLASIACDVAYRKDASYTVAYNPTPKLSVNVTVDGVSRELVQGSDYKVVADPAALNDQGVCKGITNGERPYEATIEGIGNYYGSPSQKTAYGIGKGDFKECTVSVVDGKWTGKPLNEPAVSVADAGGSVVSPDDYTYAVNDGQDCVLNTVYPVKATAKPQSNYQGTATGTYAIDAVDIYKDADTIGITYQNQVWYYDEDKNGLYEVVTADGQGNPLPEGAPLHYDAEGLPCVMPQTYTDAQTGEALTRTTYVNAEGRTLTVAEPRRKDAAGQPVYGDMAADWTGSAIRPQVIGVLYDGKLLKGATEDELAQDPELRKSARYAVIYGATNDATKGNPPYNVNATTSETQPEASVIVKGNEQGAFRNYAYMNFKIKPVAAQADNIVVKLKKPEEQMRLPYAGGRLPALPAMRNVQPTGNINNDAEVRYAPDPAAYREDDPSTYTVLDGANWKLEFDHAENAEGAPLDEKGSGYEKDAQVHLKVAPTEQCSVTGWSSKDIASAWTVYNGGASSVYITDPDIQAEVTSTVYDPNKPNPDTRLVNTRTGYTLKFGTDYDLYSDQALPAYNPKTDRIEGEVQLAGKGSYQGSLTLPYTLEKGTLEDGLFGDIMGYLAPWVWADPGVEPGTLDLILSQQLPWRQNGYNAGDLSKLLNLMVPSGDDYRGERSFTVESIEKDGEPVDKVGELGASYRLRVRFDPQRSHYFSTAQTPVQEVAASMGTSSIDGTLGLSSLSKAEISPKEYMYTGSEIMPTFAYYDAAGDKVDPSFFSFVYPQGGKGVPLEPGDYNVPSEDKSHPGRYDDLRVTGDGVHYNQNKKTDPETFGNQLRFSDATTDLSFKVVPADIADAAKVRVQVDEALYAPGAPAQPDVAFFDAATGAKLNFVKGADYTLSYRNNAQAGSPASDEPPTAIITPMANGHLTVSGQAASGMEVPFTIKGDGIDAADASWDFAPRIVVHGDGTLSQPGAVGVAGDTRLALDSYRVEAGAYADGRFTVRSDGWRQGDQAYLRVTGVKEGVLSGTKVLGPVQVVAQSEANTFAGGSQSLKAQAADILFTGKAAVPQVRASDNEAPLVEGRDFKVESASVNAGAATVAVSGLGAYAGSVDVAFSINPAPMADVAVTTKEKIYTGKQIVLDASDVDGVTLNGVVLSGADWAVKPGGFGPNVNVADGGTATLVPGTSGNLTGSSAFAFAISPAPLVNDELEIASSNATYTGAPVELSADTVQVRDTKRGRDLAFGTDFTVAGYKDNVNVGAATVYLSGAGNYSATANSVTKTFAIKPADFSQAAVEGLADSYDWRGAGTPVQPECQVALHGVVLPASDYAVSYGANDAIGADTGTLTVTPQGDNVAGQPKTASFGIAVDLARATVEAVPNATYEPGSTYEPELKVSFNGVALTEGTHYAVAYDTSTVGQKTLTVTGVQPCTGEKQVSYNIVGKPLSQDMLTADTQNLVFTGEAVTPPVSLKDGTADLVEGTDYEVGYDNNVDATGEGSPALITVTGKGNYAGLLTKAFSIAPKDLASGDIAATAKAAGLFSGAPVDAVVQASDVRGEGEPYQLVLGTDFTLSCTGNAAVGSQSAMATLVGTGNYAGTRALSYDVLGDMAAVQIQAVPDQAYTGHEVAPLPTASLAGAPLAADTDYTVSYSDNTRPGTATMTLEGMGLYVGTASIPFVITTPSYTDPATGITVSGTALVDLAADGSEVKVEVKPLSADDALYTQARDAYATDKTDAFFGWSVELHVIKDGADRLVTENFGELSISLPVGAAYDGRAATVIVRHVDADGIPVFETRGVVIDHGMASVVVDRLSDFFVAVDKAPAAGTVGLSEQEQPSVESGAGLAPTGDSLAGMPFALAAAALATLILAFPAFFRKRKS